MSVEWAFSRLARTYGREEDIRVDFTVTTGEPIKYKEISATAYAVRTLNGQGHGLQGFDTPIPHAPENTLWSQMLTVSWPRSGIIENGWKGSTTFKVPRVPGMTESVRGKYVSMDYFVEIVVKRGMLQSNLVWTRGFFLFDKPSERPTGKPVEKVLDRNDCKKGSPFVDHKVRFYLESDVASFRDPPHGYVVIESTKLPILQITVAYVRNERITVEKGQSETRQSEVCRMQLAENNPVPGVQIPFALEWVRVLIGPDVEVAQFALSVAVKVRVAFEGGGVSSVTVPVKLWRDVAY